MLKVKVTRDVTFGTLRYCFSHFCCTECGLLFSIVLKTESQITFATFREVANIKMQKKYCWLSVDGRSTVGRLSADTVSAHSRPTYRATVGRLSAKICKRVDQLWPTVGRLSVDTSTDSRPTIDRLPADVSTDSRPTVDQRELKYTWSDLSARILFCFVLVVIALGV